MLLLSFLMAVGGEHSSPPHHPHSVRVVGRRVHLDAAAAYCIATLCCNLL